MSMLAEQVRAHMSAVFGKPLPLAAIHKGPIERLGTSMDQSEGMELFNAMAIPMRQFILKDIEYAQYGRFRVAFADASPALRTIHAQFCKSLVACVQQIAKNKASVETMTSLSPVLWMALCTACALNHRESVRVLLDAFPFLLGAALPTTYNKNAQLFGPSFDFVRTHPGAAMRMMPAFVALMFSSIDTLEYLFDTGLNPSAAFGAASPASPHRDQMMVTGFGSDGGEALLEMEGPFFDLASSLRFLAPACTPDAILFIIQRYVDSQGGDADGGQRLGRAIAIAYVTSRFDVFRRGHSDNFTANSQWLKVYMESPWWGKKADE